MRFGGGSNRIFQRQQPPNSADRLYINAAENRLCINTAGVLGGQLPFVLHIHGDLARLQLVEVASVGFPTAQLGYAASRGSTGRLERFCRAVGSMYPRRFEAIFRDLQAPSIFLRLQRGRSA